MSIRFRLRAMWCQVRGRHDYGTASECLGQFRDTPDGPPTYHRLAWAMCRSCGWTSLWDVTKVERILAEREAAA